MTDDKKPDNKEEGNEKKRPLIHRVPAIIMTATRLLQNKIGTGKIERDRIEDGEFIIKQARASKEAGEFIAAHMQEMDDFIPKLKNDPQNTDTIDEITKSIMRFKGNVSMFSADQCADLAAVMLRWVESVETVDQDVLDVLNGYHVTLNQVQNNILDDDKMVGIIVNEMKSACNRYFNKHPELKLQAEITNSNAFYVSEEKLDSAEGSDIDNALSNEDFDKAMSDEKLIEQE